MLRPKLALISAAIAAAAFALGWMTHPRPAVAASPASPLSPSEAPASAACSEGDAMKANQNLVDQLQEAKRLQMVAEGQAALAELRAKSAERDKAKPSMLRSNRDEWARMAKDGKFRLRTPCSSWAGSSTFRQVTPGRRSGATVGRSDMHTRLGAAGFEPEDRELLATAYEKAHSRTWQSIKGACEEGPFFKEAISESNAESDADRVSICEASLLPNEAHVRAAMKRVAESHSAGNPMPGTEPQDRVAFALSESVDVLYDEMKKAFGEEKATRLMDFGVLCTNEASYDLTEGS